MEVRGHPRYDGIELAVPAPMAAAWSSSGLESWPAFKTAAFAEGCTSRPTLQAGMVFEGVATNGAAFVDSGVHQDGLVRIHRVPLVRQGPSRDRQPPELSSTSRCLSSTSRERISLALRLTDEPVAGQRRSTDRRDRAAN